MDAATDLASILETVEATRGDVAELRHEMRRELEVIKVRVDLCATKADLHAAMWTQTRWILAALAVLLAADVVAILLVVYFKA